MDSRIQSMLREKGMEDHSSKTRSGNILVTSISRKIPMLQAIARAAGRMDPTMNVIGSDADSRCLGRYFVSGFRQSPDWDHLEEDQLLSLCRTDSIFAVIPTRDGELSFWAKRKDFLEEHGIRVMVSPPAAVEACLDKSAFFHACRSAGLPVIPTFTKPEEISAAWLVVKGRFGAGSRNVRLKVSPDEAKKAAGEISYPIFQPWLEGKEYSLDLYRTQKGRIMGPVVRTRDLICNGESQVTTTAQNLELEKIGAQLASFLQLYGHATLQAIEDHSGKLHLLECNARFGGASTLSLSAGLDSFYWFLLEARGESVEELPFFACSRCLRQVRYPADLVYEVAGGNID